MKNLVLLICLVTFSLLMTSCHSDYYGPPQNALSKSILQRLHKGVYEIVVPKVEDEKIVYDRPLPFDKLSFKERNDKYISIGTAFFIDDKRMVSAAHVFGADSFTVWKDFFVRDTEGNVYPVNKFYKYSQYRDYVEFDLTKYPKNIQPLTINDKVEIGDTVFAVGNAQGEGISTRGGQVASFTFEPVNGKWKYIRFSSPASPGNSGGPLVNTQGEVVGVIVMKNSTENYNYALPVNERKVVSSEKATFFLRNLSVRDGIEIVSKDWNESANLPATFEELSKIAVPSKDKHYGNLLSTFKTEKADFIFPKNKMFKVYLRNQEYGNDFGQVDKDDNLNEWTVKHTRMKKIKIDKDRFVHFGEGTASSYEIMVEKPHGMPLKEFIENPKEIMDALLKGIGGTRRIGREHVRILSYGEPDKRDKWTDAYGRKWLSSIWHIKYNNVMLANECLPVPKGVACLLSQYSNENYNAGYSYFLRENVIEKPLSYQGTLLEWKDFLALGDEYVPKNFQLKNLKYKSKKWVHGILQNFDFKLKLSNLTDNSKFQVYMGYSTSEPIKLEIIGANLQFNESKNNGLHITSYLKPSEMNSKFAKRIWNEVKNKSGEFSGRTFSKGSVQGVRHVLQAPGRHLASKDNNEDPDKYYVAYCYNESTEVKTKSDRVCKEVLKGVTIKN